ncbi:hypothetical protein D3C74_359080 [compost metagenome]
MCGFLPINGRDDIRVEDGVLTQIGYGIDTRIITPPLVIRLHSHFAGDNVRVHRVEVFYCKFRINNASLVPFRPLRQRILHLRLYRSVYEFSTGIFHPQVRMRIPCDREQVEVVQRLVYCYAVTAMLFHEFQCNILDVFHRFWILESQFFFPVVPNPDEVWLFN